MTNLPNCLLIVTAEVDAAVEADWNRWYDEVHVPDVLACPGVRGGQRYISSGKAVEWGRGQRREPAAKVYAAVYHLDSPAVVETAQFLAMRGWHHFAPHVRSQTRVVVSMAG